MKVNIEVTNHGEVSNMAIDCDRDFSIVNAESEGTPTMATSMSKPSPCFTVITSREGIVEVAVWEEDVTVQGEQVFPANKNQWEISKDMTHIHIGPTGASMPLSGMPGAAIMTPVVYRNNEMPMFDISILRYFGIMSVDSEFLIHWINSCWYVSLPTLQRMLSQWEGMPMQYMPYKRLIANLELTLAATAVQVSHNPSRVPDAGSGYGPMVGMNQIDCMSPQNIATGMYARSGPTSI